MIIPSRLTNTKSDDQFHFFKGLIITSFVDGVGISYLTIFQTCIFLDVCIIAYDAALDITPASFIELLIHSNVLLAGGGCDVTTIFQSAGRPFATTGHMALPP